MAQGAVKKFMREQENCEWVPCMSVFIKYIVVNY